MVAEECDLAPAAGVEVEEVPGRVAVDPFLGRLRAVEVAFELEEAEKVVVLGEEDDLVAGRTPAGPLS